ncbi:hypothetical protein GGQ92_002526 [Gracilibacillus halotolerans]|uniref:Uncharacterized protein n=1 Tax=Gracilibacillus halotolerans TaxID=74386 RepID=A0A841RPB1_9BACI|nr:hypothetical protein [Gracilibacillus halotolerans]MBB6513712.1 hypothetical protein [Gracilibacillus halotolerans]
MDNYPPSKGEIIIGNCCCGSTSSSSINPSQPFFTQTEGTLAIPFGAGIETTVLSLPVTTTFNLQNVKLDYALQLAFAFTAGNNNLDYGGRVRLRRDGVLLATQTYTNAKSRTGNPQATVSRIILPNTWFDNEALLGQHTYTVTIEYYQRLLASTTLTVETRSLNAVVFGM